MGSVTQHATAALPPVLGLRSLFPLLRVRFQLILKPVPSDPITSLNLEWKWKDGQDERPHLEAVVAVF